MMDFTCFLKQHFAGDEDEVQDPSGTVQELLERIGDRDSRQN